MKSREMAGSWLPKNCSGEGGGGGLQLTVDSKNEEENSKKLGGGGTPFPEFQCGAETPRSLVELSLLSH